MNPEPVNAHSLSIPVLNPKASSWIGPLKGTVLTGNTAGPAFQTTCEFYLNLICFLVGCVEMSRADVKAILNTALFTADLVVDFDVAFLVLLDGIKE